MSKTELNKPIWQMTAGEFLDLFKQEFSKNEEKKEVDMVKEKRYVYGLRGLANLLNCSVATASRIKKSGVIDSAISQKNRTIVVDCDKVIELLKNK
ncbi:DUF3853 family protein [Ornithobacterium rhinotracheale]